MELWFHNLSLIPGQSTDTSPVAPGPGGFPAVDLAVLDDSCLFTFVGGCVYLYVCVY